MPTPAYPAEADAFALPEAADWLSSALVARGFRYCGADVEAGEKRHVFRRGGLRVRLCLGEAEWRVDLHYRLFGEEEWFDAEIFWAYFELQAGLVTGGETAMRAEFVGVHIEAIARLVSGNAGLAERLRTLQAIAREPLADDGVAGRSPTLGAETP